MSEIVANLDAALADYRATQDNIARSIVIFGREWDLVPELTTTTANALAQVVLLADDINENDGRNAMGALGAVADILPSVVAEPVRDEFRREWVAKGVPLGALELIVEAVMTAFTAAPFSQEPPQTENVAATPAPSAASGSSPMPTGATSNPPLPAGPMPSPPAPPVETVFQSPVPALLGLAPPADTVVPSSGAALGG